MTEPAAYARPDQDGPRHVATPPRTGHPDVDAALAALADPTACSTGDAATLSEHAERLARVHEALHGLMSDSSAAHADRH